MAVDRTRAWVLDIHTRADELVKLIAKAFAEQGNPITCQGTGCWGCCNERVLAHRAEIEHALAGITSEQRERVKQRTRGWLEKVIPSGLLKEKSPNKVKWRLLGAYCPFLENGKCMIYHDRPIVCRMHNAVRSPDYCFDEGLRQNQRYATSPDAEDNMHRYMFQRLAESGDRYETNNLGVLLAEILLHRSVDCASLRRMAPGEVQAVVAKL